MYQFKIKGYEGSLDPYYYNPMKPVDVTVFAPNKEIASFNAEKIVGSYIHPDTISMEIRDCCTNDSKVHPVDEFICSKCGLILRDLCRYEVDEDAEPPDENCYEFEVKFCPRCGREVVE